VEGLTIAANCNGAAGANHIADLLTSLACSLFCRSLRAVWIEAISCAFWASIACGTFIVNCSFHEILD
jgi:hypothetical protein